MIIPNSFDDIVYFSNGILGSDKTAAKNFTRKINKMYSGVIKSKVSNRPKDYGTPRAKALQKTTFPEFYLPYRFPKIYETPTNIIEDVIDKRDGSVCEFKMVDLTTHFKPLKDVPMLYQAKDILRNQFDKGMRDSKENFKYGYGIVCLSKSVSHAYEENLEDEEFLKDCDGNFVKYIPAHIDNMDNEYSNKLMYMNNEIRDEENSRFRKYFYLNYIKYEVIDGRFEIIYERYKELEEVSRNLHKSWSF